MTNPIVSGAASDPEGTVTLTGDHTTRQSLANGAIGVALLHIERALDGTGAWIDAHAAIRHVADVPIDAGEHAGLFYGAPALAFVLHAGALGGHRGYGAAATRLDQHVLRLTRQRLDAAIARLNAGGAATFHDYDLIYGLTGLGVLLLRHLPSRDELGEVLGYLIRLTHPRRRDGLQLPGWWVEHAPDPLLPTPGGHANHGMAHGAAGILAFLALASLRGHTVEGQADAIAALTDWFDRWRQDSADGPWWPQWLTRQDLRTGQPSQAGPGRPSWCYGATGITRALQLAALALSDRPRQRAVEETMAACLTGRQFGLVTEPGLCHGLAGIYQTAYRAAQDAASPSIGHLLPGLAASLAQHAKTESSEPGLLTGATGIALVLETLRHDAPPRSGWDACLLIT